MRNVKEFYKNLSLNEKAYLAALITMEKDFDSIMKLSIFKMLEITKKGE